MAKIIAAGAVFAAFQQADVGLIQGRCPGRGGEHGRPAPLQYAVTPPTKHAPHPVQPCRCNSGGDRPFQTGAPGSNEDASAVCGWRHQGQRGNQMTAQPETKAENAAPLYTAKRMICYLFSIEIG